MNGAFFDGKLSPVEFPGQFVLTTIPEEIPEEWTKFQFEDWWLGTLDLPVVKVEDASGRRIGLCVGHPLGDVDPESNALVIPSRDPEPGKDDMEEFYREVAGRYVLISVGNERQRLYLDPYGSLSTVYAVDRPIVASNPHLAGAGDWEVDLIRTLRMPESGLWFPSGSTPRKGVKRLLPNHFLDLRDWTVQRFWPASPSDLTVEPDWRRGVAEIVGGLERTFAQVADRFPVQVPLTAGRDSRMLLACARKFLSQTTFATFSERSLTIDMQIAGELARRFGLSHEFLTSA